MYTFFLNFFLLRFFFFLRKKSHIGVLGATISSVLTPGNAQGTSWYQELNLSLSHANQILSSLNCFSQILKFTIQPI